MILARRRFLTGLIAAPFVVRASSLMKINPGLMAASPDDLVRLYIDALLRSRSQTKEMFAAQILDASFIPLFSTAHPGTIT